LSNLLSYASAVIIESEGKIPGYKILKEDVHMWRNHEPTTWYFAKQDTCYTK